jgi:rhodanese-related sulfurtransferase
MKISKILSILFAVMLLLVSFSCTPTTAGSTVTITTTKTNTQVITSTITGTATQVITSTITGTTTSTAPQSSEFEVIRAAAEAYAKSGKVTEITAKDLYTNLKDGKPGNDPFIINVRWDSSELVDIYLLGHIDTSFNVPQDLIFTEQPIMVPRAGYTEELQATKIPKTSQVVVVSHNGSVGDQVTALLNILGYDAVNLKWGMTSWTKDTNVAPGRYQATDSEAYRIDTSPYLLTDTYSLPVIENAASSDSHEIIRAAADAYATSGKTVNITSSALNARLKNHDTSDNPLILCVDDANTYAKGHVTQAVNIPFADLFTEANLKKLPTDQKIVVYSYNGHIGSQATALLNILGYDATNLIWGIASWTFDSNIAPDRYNESTDCMGYPYVNGTLPSVYSGYY